MTKALFSKLTTCIFLLLFAFLCFTSSIVAFLNDVNINLMVSKFVVGQVVAAEARKIERTGFLFKTYKTVFYVKLNCSKENFAIYRSNENYQDLQAQINTGDSLKVYYRTSINNYNSHVFQVEKNGKVLADYKEYNKEASSSAYTVFFIGIALTVCSMLYYRNFNLMRFLTSWVEH